MAFELKVGTKNITQVITAACKADELAKLIADAEAELEANTRADYMSSAQLDDASDALFRAKQHVNAAIKLLGTAIGRTLATS